MDQISTELPTFHLALLGDIGVGKTSLLTRYIDGDFHKLPIPTLGKLTSKSSPYKNSNILRRMSSFQMPRQ